MIEFKIGDDHISGISLSGNLGTIILESEMFVSSVYTSLLNYDEESAEMFKQIFPVLVSTFSDEIFRKGKIKSGSGFTIKVPRKGDRGNENP